MKESNREPGLIKTGRYTTLVVYTTSVTVAGSQGRGSLGVFLCHAHIIKVLTDLLAAATWPLECAQCGTGRRLTIMIVVRTMTVDRPAPLTRFSSGQGPPLDGQITLWLVVDA